MALSPRRHTHVNSLPQPRTILDGMKEAKTWSRESNPYRFGGPQGCSVEGCDAHPTLVMAGDESGTARMCVRHAEAWSESSLCRDVAQHNSGASQLALSTWLNIVQARGLAEDRA